MDIDIAIELLIKHFGFKYETIESIKNKCLDISTYSQGIHLHKDYCHTLMNGINENKHNIIIDTLKKYADENALNKYMENEGYQYIQNEFIGVLANEFIIYHIKHNKTMRGRLSKKSNYKSWKFETINEEYCIAYH